MKVTLRRFLQSDLPSLDHWQREIDAGRYMERLSPASLDASGFEGWGIDFVWYVITSDGADVGCVWIEAKRNQPCIGILGIVIGKTEALGRGIGRQAVAAAIEEGRRVLGFDTVRLHVRRNNARAIACYGRCGFVVTGEGEKPFEDGGKVPFLRMELPLGEPGLPDEVRISGGCGIHARCLRHR